MNGINTLFSDFLNWILVYRWRLPQGLHVDRVTWVCRSFGFTLRRVTRFNSPLVHLVIEVTGFQVFASQGSTVPPSHQGDSYLDLNLHALCLGRLIDKLISSILTAPTYHSFKNFLTLLYIGFTIETSSSLCYTLSWFTVLRSAKLCLLRLNCLRVLAVLP